MGEVARLRCKLAASMMARKTCFLELSVAQVRIEQQLAMLGDELQKCPSPGSPTREEEAPGMDAKAIHAAIEADCERMLAFHDQLDRYLVAIQKGDDKAAAECLDSSQHDEAGVLSDQERESLSTGVKELFESCTKAANELEAPLHWRARPSRGDSTRGEMPPMA